MEALSQARPVVIYQILPGQEAGNVALVARTGAGCYIPDIDALVRAIAAYAYGRFAGDTTPAGWWSSAARRVAAHLLAARAERW